uniref:Uncharacterized protein n=1 Tax=Glossina brevipalpis TaxID=37001 RepID=A0A1A9W315_9MUSC
MYSKEFNNSNINQVRLFKHSTSSRSSYRVSNFCVTVDARLSFNCYSEMYFEVFRRVKTIFCSIIDNSMDPQTAGLYTGSDGNGDASDDSGGKNIEPYGPKGLFAVTASNMTCIRD